MKKRPKVDVLMIDEIDETVLEFPYEFQDGSDS
jgi:hypothetical protein